MTSQRSLINEEHTNKSYHQANTFVARLWAAAADPSTPFSAGRDRGALDHRLVPGPQRAHGRGTVVLMEVVRRGGTEGVAGGRKVYPRFWAPLNGTPGGGTWAGGL